MKWPFLHYFLAFFVQLRLLERLQKLRGNQLFVLFQLHFASLKQTKIEQIKDRESVCVKNSKRVERFVERREAKTTTKFFTEHLCEISEDKGKY